MQNEKEESLDKVFNRIAKVSSSCVENVEYKPSSDFEIDEIELPNRTVIKGVRLNLSALLIVSSLTALVIYLIYSSS